jgi:hypothetical protein
MNKVKPVYNDNPWNQKKWSLFSGCFSAKVAWTGFRVVVVDRWSLFEGGLLHSFDCIGKNVAAQRYP